MFDDRVEPLGSSNSSQALLKNPPGIAHISRDLGTNRISASIKSVENGDPVASQISVSSLSDSAGQENRWYHVAWTFHSHNQGDSLGHFRWYIDGQLDAQFSNGLQTALSSDFRIGADESDRSNSMKFAELRLYDRILHTEEISELAGDARFKLKFPYPDWWGLSSSGSLEPSYAFGVPEEDYAPTRLGQLKYMASKARSELEVFLAPVGGAGLRINTFVDGFDESDAHNQSVVNIGQLKYTASLFYDRFLEVGFQPSGIVLDTGEDDFAKTYPWIDQRNDSSKADYAALNGQLKYLFSWDIQAWAERDIDDNGAGDDLPDWWELFYADSLNELSGFSDTDSDGATDFDEFTVGTDPTDFFDGKVSEYNLKVINTITPAGAIGSIATPSLQIEVRDVSGALVPNTPVYLKPAAGTGMLSIYPDGAQASRELLVHTNANGVASVFIQP